MNNIHYTRIGNLGMELKFLNGTIIVPDEYGAYVIASGCGSGKTTAIKQIIRENYQSGVLYSAFTIEECNEMYQYCKKLVEILDDPDSLSLDDIIVLHSDYKSEGTDNNLWRNNPTELYNKKILICTHSELVDKNLGVFINTNFRYEYYEDLDLISQVMHGRIEGNMRRFLPRKFLLIDEVPESNDFKRLIIEGMKITLLLFDSESSIYRESVLDKSIEYSELHPDRVIGFKGLDIIYPKRLHTTKGSIINLESKIIEGGRSWGSRSNRLSNRSHQEELFDLLIRIGYFTQRVYREVIIPTESSYIIADYYFPDNRLIVELDSDLHDESSDEERDLYLSILLGLQVIRIKDFKGSDYKLNFLNSILSATNDLGELQLNFSFRDPDFSLALMTKVSINSRLLDIVPNYDYLSNQDLCNSISTNKVGILKLESLDNYRRTSLTT